MTTVGVLPDWIVETCERKRVYRTYLAAKRHCESLRHKDGDDQVAPYQCPVCKEWHVGHPKRGKGKPT